ncbi:MAG: DUF2461 domain-containing protein [Patescibacteria group bacterium]
MLLPKTFIFLKNLSKNNNKEWFEKNRSDYEEIRENLKKNAQKLINGLEMFDEQIRYKGLQPKNCLFRINRDVRFSNNKSPYKTNMALHFDLGSKAVSSSTYYIHISPEDSFVGGGIYMPMPPELYKIRIAISQKYKQFQSIINSKQFIKYFPNGISTHDSLKTVPRGFKENNPAIEYLRMKGYTALCPLTNDELTNDDCFGKILEHFKALYPLNKFLNEAVVAEV